MRITIFELEEWERAWFDHLSEGNEVTLLSEPLTPKNAGQHADAEVISTFIYSDISEEVIEKLESLRLIATRSTSSLS